MSSSDWPEVRLGDLVDIKHGFAFAGQHFRDEPSTDVLLTPGNFAIGGGFRGDKLKFYEGPVPEDFVLSAGDLLITMTDLSKEAETLGYPARVPDSPENRYLHNQRLGKVTVRDGAALIPGYLYYVLCSPPYRHEVLAGATGTTVKHTSPARIGQFRFRLPPLAEQRRISRTLGALDDKVELNRRVDRTLESIARAIFKSWFVDFDPVRKKMEGKTGGELGLPPSLAALFPASLQASSIGPIPRGWRVGTCEEDFSIRMGQSPPGDTYNDSGIGLPFYQGCRDFGDHYPSRRVFCSAPSRFADRGDTLVSVRAPVGSLNLATERCCIGRGLAAVRHRSGASWYTHETMCRLRERFRRLESGGTVFGSLSGKEFRALCVLVPPVGVVTAYEATIDSLAKLHGLMSSQSTRLRRLRDGLLPHLLAGGSSTEAPCRTVAETWSQE